MIPNWGERWSSGYVSASQAKGRMIEAHNDPCSFLQGEKILKKKFGSVSQQNSDDTLHKRNFRSF